MEVASQAQLNCVPYKLLQMRERPLQIFAIIVVAIIRVRGSDHVSNSIRRGHAAHGDRDVPGFRSIIYFRQNVRMNVDHGSRLRERPAVAQLDLSRFSWKEKAMWRKYPIAEVAEKNCTFIGPLDWSRIFSRSLQSSSATPALQRLAVSFANEICDSGVGFRQSLFLWQEHDTEVMRARFLAEAGTVHNHHMFMADKFLHKDFVALRDIDARESVERAAGRNTAHTGSGLAPLLSEIAA